VAIFALGCAAQPSLTVRFPALYIDMDGTTLTSKHTIKPKTLEALSSYRRCGGKFGIATGRTLQQVKPYLTEIQPNLPLVLFNGAVTTTPTGDGVLNVEALSPKTLNSAVAAALSQKQGVIGVVVQGPDLTIVDQFDEPLKKRLSSSFITNPRIDPAFQLQAGDVAVKVLVFAEPAFIDSMKSALKNAVGADARVIVTSPEAVEVVKSGVDKANTIRKILVNHNIDPWDVLTVGDSGNDVNMVSLLGLGAAMDNCRKETCDAATVRIGNHDTDALGNFLEKALLTRRCMAR
jgi:Cof subfamily protein (haloacid dehalogenase superfamily)